MKKLWRTLSAVLGKGETQESEKLSFSGDDFATFVHDKVEAVRSTTSTTLPHDVTVSRTSRRQQSTSGLR